jgi:uncharacterized glyoxalase superfamily protein PhnB
VVVDELASTIRATRPMVAAKDFAVSQAFYRDVGFVGRPLNDTLVEMSLGSCSFILQDYYQREWAENSVLHLYVSDLAPWWARIEPVATRHSVRFRAPHRSDWGATIADLIDPAGVLWTLHETKS